MSPSLPSTRPVWVWSLPAFAIILSFLWYRKKRGSLKTDSGGAGETDDLACVQELPFAQESVEPVDANLQLKAFEEPEEDEDSKQPKQPENPQEETLLQLLQLQLQFQPKEPEQPEEEELRQPQEEEQEQPGELQQLQLQLEQIVADVTDVTEIVARAVEEAEKSLNKCGNNLISLDMAKISTESSFEPRQNKDENNTACILEQKLAKLDLAKQCSGDETEKQTHETHEDEAERDSANNSPSEVMLASPSVSGYSDTHSEGSSDSGKGCSEMLTPSRTPASGNSVSGDIPVTSLYEFVIPQQFVGRLIGRHGSYINEIKEATHAIIYIKRHPDTPKLKICAIEGTQMDIDSALEMVRRKFPKKRYPNITLEQVILTPELPMVPVLPENMQLYLVEGINNDVILSSLVSAGHFFLQQPTHPTYLSLSRLNSCMALCYSEPNQPTIPEGVGAGILCAAPVHNGWYRAQITTIDSENDACNVKFVDYGGYMSLPMSQLRQIRADFINLPFQAAECYLAGIKPVGEEEVWSEEAKESVEKLTFGMVLQAQVYGYAEDGVPLIYLYTVFNNEVVLINQELVDRGFAEWLYSEPVTEEAQQVQESGELAPESLECPECPQLKEPEPVAVAV